MKCTMQRIIMEERTDWQAIAEDHGFTFHHYNGEQYWNEGAVYAFTLDQIERDIEDPSGELHAMCLDLVDRAVVSEEMLDLLRIPESARDIVANSWKWREPSLYGRFDFAYDGTGPAKMLEYNADTPTSIYETAYYQWLWLEDRIAAGKLPADADQYNSLHEALIDRFKIISPSGGLMHFASVTDHVEDRQTVRYLEDVARQAGLDARFVAINQIGISTDGRFVDTNNVVIERLFKLYPWEDMFLEDFAKDITNAGTRFVEPAWKAILSNKAMLPLLWERNEGHPNLLPAAFESDRNAAAIVGPNYVKKPIFSREGWDIELVDDRLRVAAKMGGYGAEGYIYQQARTLPVFDGQYAVIGSWIVGDSPVAMSVREDAGPVTRDLARFVPHVIVEDGAAIRP